jgi:endonuclease/exonuclease/phosphatase family metal-dependent hydrolase
LLSWLWAGCGSDTPSGSTGQDASTQDGSTGHDTGSKPQPTTPGPMRLVSWNVHNFYDDVRDTCGGCPYEDVVTTSKYTAKIRDVAQVLAQLDGDVVLLQEVENEAVLDALATSATLAPKGYVTRKLLFGNDPRGINIGLLSRTPVDRYISHKDDRFTRTDAPAYVYRFTRDAVEVHMTYRGHHVALVGVHFKARSDDDDPDRRVAEAQRARAIADEILRADPEAYVVLLGDFNDTPGTESYTWALDGADGPTFGQALASIPADQRYTYIYDNQRLLIDHLLASPNADGRLVDGTPMILQVARQASDHAAIAATYTVP